ISHFVGLVTVPRRDRFAFRHIDFVRLDERRVLAILVFTDGEVQNRAVALPRPLSAGVLEWIANDLNQNYSGLGQEEIGDRLVTELYDERSEEDKRMAATVARAQATLQIDDGEDVLVSGQTKLMGGAQGLADIERLRELFEAFQRKSELLQVLEGCLRADGVRLFIGEEPGVTSMEQCSLIAAPYASGGRVLGVLGVIGPTRMDYDRVITTVQATAQALSRTMAERVGCASAFSQCPLGIGCACERPAMDGRAGRSGAGWLRHRRRLFRGSGARNQKSGTREEQKRRKR